MPSLLDSIAQAGIAGCGGAGFPTHIKYNTQARCLIINAAECEPLLHTDKFLLREKTDEIIAAAETVRVHLGASEAIIALKKTYKAEIEALNTALPSCPYIRLHLLKNFYPAGDEQILTFEVTGRTVPPGGLPIDVGCVVSNAATLYAVHNAIEGRAFTQKYITVNGAVKNPCVLKVPVGTSFADCLAIAGGSTLNEYAVISGGPMMGKALSMAEAKNAGVTKTTSGLIVLPVNSRTVQYANLNERQTIRRARAACIQCSFCTGLCPRYLLGHPLEPHRIMRRISTDIQWREKLHCNEALQTAALCCECGVCELYACPMQLQPRKINALIKQEMRKSGIKPPRFELAESSRLFREERKIPTHRTAARAGAGKYYDKAVTHFEQAYPETVSIALNSHIGVPALPIVSVGDKVGLGQLIAQPPDSALGVCYHASIAGTVTSVEDRITIQR